MMALMHDGKNMEIKVAKELTYNQLESNILIKGLNNPHHINIYDDKTMLVVEAGSGNTHEADGRLIKVDLTEQGAHADVVLEHQPSMNMLPKMKRDEIMGLSDIATGDGKLLLSLTDYINGSKIISISPFSVNTLFMTHGHINSIVFHPVRKSWFWVKPDTNMVIELLNDGTERVVVQLDNLSDGQDAVPVCIIYEDTTQSLLVSLFSGEIGRDYSKVGVDFGNRSGQVIRVNPETGNISVVVSELTAPTGIALSDDNILYVLELCSDFLEPLFTEKCIKSCLHGGFRRHSGRLLAIDLLSQQIIVVADKLDTPSNIKINKNHMYISECMGMPGRLIPNTDGKQMHVSGFIRRVIIS